MKFGIIKSKIDSILIESYKNGTFKTEMSNFKKYVLNNKNINKLFYLYDELTSNKGLNESIVNDYINESIVIYENTVNKIKPTDLKNLLEWVKNTKTENQYEVVDTLFSDNVLTLEHKIRSKKTLSESLKKQPEVVKESVNLPLTTIVNMANKSLTDYVETLSESDRKELKTLLSVDDSELEPKYSTIKESVIKKLTGIRRENTDYEVGQRINETITKLETEKYDKLNYYKLKSLNENL
jgi:hypothetical protein